MSIIVKPIVTEKMTQLGEKLNRYGLKLLKMPTRLKSEKQLKKCTV